MPASGTFVIAGGGLAGAKTAEALREQGFDGRIVLAAEEDIRPYERPPLSKDYLQGKTGREEIFVHSPDWYDANAVELLLRTAVTGIDRGRREVTLSDGGHLAYDRLLLATGSVPRRLPLPGADADGVLYLRRAADSDRIRDAFATASRVLIIGAGWIGLEVASAARAAGVDVTILEAAELPLLHVLGPQVAPVFAGLHREHRVELRLGVRVAEMTTSGGKATGARLADGTRIGADAVIVGIGAAPQTRLAEAAGLDVRDGVVTDASLRTSDPAIYAAGDIASAFHLMLGTHIRVEHWANALHQPQTAAAAMLGRDAVLRPGAVLLHRPVRPGHGIRRLRRAWRLRPGGLPRRRRQARVHRVLDVRRPRRRRDERQHLGRQRRDPGPDPVRPARRPGPARRPRRTAR